MLKPLWPAGSLKSGRIQPSLKRKRENNKKFELHNIIETASECRGTDDFENLNSQKDIPREVEVICLHFVNERNVESCPQIKILIGPIIHRPHWHKMPVFRNFRGLTQRVKAKGLSSFELPTQNVVLQIAFPDETKRERRQAVIEFHCNDVIIDQIFLITPQLVTNLLMGMDFCVYSILVIDFPAER
jgi:hypothetical protein